MPLRYLFLDMNSFFASVEQQERPELRGKPVGVVPVSAWSSCCIAASYEAKAHGVKTGTGAIQAKALCPDIRFALARPKKYVEYHHRIIDIVEDCIHIEKVCSIDEMYGKLYRNERDLETIQSITNKIKSSLAKQCGAYIRCSVGVAPNIWLAKAATNLQKPNGFVIIQDEEIKQQLSKLELGDLTGIGRGMSRRLNAWGIRSVAELYDLSERDLSSIWGSKIHGKAWWQKLRGYDVIEKPTKRRTVSHSHVLAPQYRSLKDAYAVTARMLHKAAYRLRKIGYWTERVTVLVTFIGREKFANTASCHPIRDTFTLLQILQTLWQSIPRQYVTYQHPLKVGVVLSDLLPDHAVTLSLFDEEEKLSTLSDTMDTVNNRFGANTLYLGSIHRYSKAAPERISFTQIPDLKSFGVEKVKPQRKKYQKN